jgi:hypothetical protein
VRGFRCIRWVRSGKPIKCTSDSPRVSQGIRPICPRTLKPLLDLLPPAGGTRWPNTP